MGQNIIAMIVAADTATAALNGGLDTELLITATVSVIGAIFSFAGAATSYFLGKRKMYVEIVIKDRLQAIEERRCALKDLYYYTSPRIIALATDPINKCKHIQGLLTTQSILEHRLLECLQPEKYIICSLHSLVDSAIDYIKNGIKNDGYDDHRTECLELLKIYNFASWQFAQKHSTGISGSSIDGFDATYIETLETAKQGEEIANRIKKLSQQHSISSNKSEPEDAGE